VTRVNKQVLTDRSLIRASPLAALLKFRRFYLKSDITKKAETTPSQELTNLEGMTNQTYLPGDRRSHTPAIAIGMAISMGVCGLLADRSVERVTAGQSATPIGINSFGSGQANADFTESHSTTSTKRVPAVLPLAVQSNRTDDALQNPYVRQLPTQIARTFNTKSSTGTKVAAQPDSVEISVPSPKNNKVPVRYGQRQLVRDPYLSHSGMEPDADFNTGEDSRPTYGQPAIGFAWPAQGSLTSKYGRRWGRMHKGIDIAGPVGTPIVSAADGTVIFAGWSSGGYGNLLEIRHNDGSTTRYGHNSRLLVSVGQQVRQNQQVAEMGSTGRSTGSHLHFEIRTSGMSAVNPMAYLPSYR
jgi:murein DD-endopeptidase MepM/ murein hydrolase activator NlpD